MRLTKVEGNALYEVKTERVGEVENGDANETGSAGKLN